MSDDAVARSDALDAKLDDNPIVTNLVKVARQHGLILKILVGSLVFDFVLSGAIFVLSVRSSDNAAQANKAVKAATSAQAQAYNQCLSGNDSRHTQLQLWEFILAIPPDPNLTPEQRQRQQVESTRFRRYVQKKLAPRDCSRLKPVRTSTGALRFVPLPRRPNHTQQPQPSQPTVVVVPSQQPSSTRAQPRRRSPTPERTHRPSAEPTHSASPSPTPLACILGHCVSPLSRSLSGTTTHEETASCPHRAHLTASCTSMSGAASIPSESSWLLRLIAVVSTSGLLVLYWTRARKALVSGWASAASSARRLSRSQ